MGGEEGWRGMWGAAWLSSFSHTALTKTSLFSWPVTQGDALMIARCLSQGSRLNFSTKLQSPALFVYFCLSVWELHILTLWCLSLRSATVYQWELRVFSGTFFCNYVILLYVWHARFSLKSRACYSPVFPCNHIPTTFLCSVFFLCVLCAAAVKKVRTEMSLQYLPGLLKPQSRLIWCITEWWHLNYHLLKAFCAGRETGLRRAYLPALQVSANIHFCSKK